MDTVCNTFGGILFIMILVAIQVQETVEQPPSETCSPERMAELVQRAEELVNEIESAMLLAETIRKTLPEPSSENDKQLAATYSELIEKKNGIVAKKSSLTNDCMAQAKENADLERLLSEIEKKLEELNALEAQLTQTVQQAQSEQRDLERKTDDLQGRIDKLKDEVAQKEKQAKDRHDPDKNTRREKLILPKMQDSGSLEPYYFVLRFNRFYNVLSDFDYEFKYGTRYLGRPKKNHGFPVNDSDAVKRQIRSAFQGLSPGKHYIGIIVYGDSVDSFHVVRDIIIDAKFRYELMTSLDDKDWPFGSGSGSTQVQ